MLPAARLSTTNTHHHAVGFRYQARGRDTRDGRVPKGANLRHVQLYMNADIPRPLFDVQSSDIVITVLPLFHVFARSRPPCKDHVSEVVTRGLHVMKGYRNTPEANADSLTGDWFHTGDLGYFDDDRFLFIIGRIKELIIRGGYNVYPAEIEDAIHAHPAVAEAAVVGFPREVLGKEVRAVVTVRPGAALSAPELIAYCKERMAAYKYPRVVEFRAELPKNAMRKILKDQLVVPAAE